VFQEALRTVLDTGAVRRLELPFVAENGSVAAIRRPFSSMREERGGANSVVVVMTDVTEAALLQAKLAHTEKMAALGHWYLAWLMRSQPVVGDHGFTDLLWRSRAAGICKEQLGVILRSERTRLIVQNMFAFAGKCPAARARAMNVSSATLKFAVLWAVEQECGVWNAWRKDCWS